MKSDKEKIAQYERLLHMIHACYAVVCDNKKVKQLLDNVSSWSYAHRSGNGMISEEEQQVRIDRAFDNLLELGDK